MQPVSNDWTTAKLYNWMSIVDHWLLFKNFQEEQLNSRRFPVFPQGISNSSRLPFFPWFPEFVDTLFIQCSHSDAYHLRGWIEGAKKCTETCNFLTEIQISSKIGGISYPIVREHTYPYPNPIGWPNFCSGSIRVAIYVMCEQLPWTAGWNVKETLQNSFLSSHRRSYVLPTAHLRWNQLLQLLLAALRLTFVNQ